MNGKSRNTFFILTPIALLVVTQLTALILGQRLQAWVYFCIDSDSTIFEDGSGSLKGIGDGSFLRWYWDCRRYHCL